MNKIYILAPLLGIAVFFGFYYNFSKKYEAELERKAEVARAELKAKQLRENEARQKAYEDAIKAQAERKAEREERQRIEEEKKQARLDLEDKRLRAFDERRRLRETADRLKKEVDAVQEELDKILAEKASNEAELAFLQDYVKSTRANMNTYYALLDKISNVEKDIATAAAAAAAAAKKG